MSPTYGDLSQSLCVRCSDVGLDCNYVIFGNSEEKLVDITILHMFEYHAINPEEMTSEMKWKIKENLHRSSTQQVVQTVSWSQVFQCFIEIAATTYKASHKHYSTWDRSDASLSTLLLLYLMTIYHFQRFGETHLKLSHKWEHWNTLVWHVMLPQWKLIFKISQE